MYFELCRWRTLFMKIIRVGKSDVEPSFNWNTSAPGHAV
jgi:hypothetical protein